MLALLNIFADSEPRSAAASWHDIPAVRILGAVLGIMLIYAAIRAMFGSRKDR
jgi:hypothetical protein